MFRLPLIAIVISCGLALPGLAHEFWIEPHEYQVESGADLRADLRVGENFAGSPQAYFDTRIERFELHGENGAEPYSGRLGDIPALDAIAPASGLLVIVHQTTPASLKYREWQDFQAFAAHKDFPDIRARHLARGLPETGFRESYTRFAKALVAVDGGAGSDHHSGMTTEFVALDNPYSAPSGATLRVQLLYQGSPRADAQVEIFEKTAAGVVQVTATRTDADGIARIATSPGHSYLLDAVVLRPYEGLGEAVWESLWASLSFHAP